MKILYHHRIASKDGQYVHLEELINSFKKQGNEIILVGPKIVETSSFGSEGGLVFHLKKYIPKIIYEAMEFSYSFFDFFRIMFYIVKEKPDFIYERYNLFFISGIWAKKLTGLPLLLEINAPIYEERNKFDGIALKQLAKWSQYYCWKNADYRLPVTRVLADMVIDATKVNDRIEVVHNGINEERFNINQTQEEIKKELGLENKLVLGFTGFVRDWHGLEQVIDILKEHPDHRLHLLLVGDGPAREFLESYAHRLDVHHQVTFTGIVDRNKVNYFVNAFDIALQPAVVPYASPLKMFEYMFMGKLIVAPDNNNIKEILENGKNAILFKHDEKGAFKKAVLKAIKSINNKTLPENANESIYKKGFLWDKNANRIIMLVDNKLLGNK